MNAVVPLQTRTSLQPQTFEQMMKYAEVVSKSDLVPKDYQGKPHNCLIAMQWASELGMNPLQGLQNIAVINGRPSLWGDMLPALVKNHPSYEWMEETLVKDDAGNVTAAECKGKRRGHPNPETRRFSIDDAKKAGLWGKSGPWASYPQRMLQMRARAWLCRDLWSDALRGLSVAEEAQDIEITQHERPQTFGEQHIPAAQITDERKGRCDEAAEQYAFAVSEIKRLIEADDAHGVAESWAEIPQAAQMDLWLAPTKGGVFTTAERDYIKTKLPREAA